MKFLALNKALTV